MLRKVLTESGRTWRISPMPIIGRRPTAVQRYAKGPSLPPAALALAAWSASHTKCLGALYRRWIKRLPKNTAIIALAHRILVIIYHVMTTSQPYRELGPTHNDERVPQILTRTVRRLERRG